jgi:hypothetical protein
VLITSGVRCAFSIEIYTRLPLVLRPLLRLKRCHACDPIPCISALQLLPGVAVNSAQTLKAPDNLSVGAPRTSAEIERFMEESAAGLLVVGGVKATTAHVEGMQVEQQ